MKTPLSVAKSGDRVGSPDGWEIKDKTRASLYIGDSWVSKERFNRIFATGYIYRKGERVWPLAPKGEA